MSEVPLIVLEINYIFYDDFSWNKHHICFKSHWELFTRDENLDRFIFYVHCFLAVWLISQSNSACIANKKKGKINDQLLITAWWGLLPNFEREKYFCFGKQNDEF